MMGYFRFLLALLSSPMGMAQVTDLQLVAARDDRNKEPAVIRWNSFPGQVSYYVIEGEQESGSWIQFQAVASGSSSAALWQQFCVVRVGVVHDDVLAQSDNHSEPLEICSQVHTSAVAHADPHCSTLADLREVHVVTTDRSVALEWKVAPGDNVTSYSVQVKRSLIWHDVATVEPSSLPGHGSCWSQVGKVLDLAANTKFVFRVTATGHGKLSRSESVTVITKASRCAESLFGEPLFDPNDVATTAVFSAERVKAQWLYEANKSEFHTVWFARVEGFLYHWENAFDVLAGGWQRFPTSFRIPRHIGHRLIGRRNIENATRWLELARENVRGKPATGEFFPIEFRIIPLVPKSSSQFNIYYHLGLSYFLVGNYTAAAAVYEEGFHWAFTEFDEGDDAFIAMNYWLVNSYHRIGTPKALEASSRLLANVSSIKDTYHIVESLGWGYYYGLLLFKGHATPKSVLAMVSTEPGLAMDTYGYAVAQYLFVQNTTETRRQARQLMGILRAGPMWSGFGYIGAEYDLFSEVALSSPIIV